MESIFNTQITSHIGSVVALIGSSLLMRVVLQYCGQQWVTTYAHTSTIVVLPIITYVITNVISGNIALSLGMVGALSIVRFRNPVRSPIELAMYFGAITFGISAAVDLRWLLFLVAALLLALATLWFVSKASSALFQKQFFNTSFSEGNLLNSLQVELVEPHDSLDRSVLLSSKVKEEGLTSYVFVSGDLSPLEDLIREVELSPSLRRYQLSKSQ